MKIITPIEINDSNMASTIPEPDASQGEVEWLDPSIGTVDFDFSSDRVIQTLLHSSGDSYLIGSTSTGDDHLFKIDKDDQSISTVASYSGIYRTIAEGFDGNLYFAGQSSQFMKYTVSDSTISFFGTAEPYYYSSCTGLDGNIYLSGTEDLTKQFTKIDVSTLSVSEFGTTNHFVRDMTLSNDGFMYGITDRVDGEVSVLKVDAYSLKFSTALAISAIATRISSANDYLLLAGSGSFIKIDTDGYSFQAFGSLRGTASKIINVRDDIFYCSAYDNETSIAFIDADSFNVINLEANGDRGSLVANGEYVYAFKRFLGDSVRFNLVPVVGERFIYKPTHKIYAVATSNTDNPSEGVNKIPPSWVEVSATNKYKPFDYSLSTKTEFNDTDDVFQFTPGELVTAISFLGLEGVTEVYVQVREDNESGSLIYSKSISTYMDTPLEDVLSNDSILNDKVIFEDLPIYENPYISVSFDKTTVGSYSVGAIVIGNARTLGRMTYLSSTSRKSYDSIEVDDFGSETIINRPSAEYTTFEMVVFPQYANYVERILKDSLNKPRIYVGDKQNNEKIFTFGYYELSPISYDDPSLCTTTLKVRGLV